MSDYTTKTCGCCGNEYPLAPEFWTRRKRNKDGFDSQCKICKQATDRRWKAENPDKVAAGYARFKENSPEKLKDNRRRYYEKHRDKLLEQQKAYYQENVERVRETHKRWYRANREQHQQAHREWVKANPEKDAEYKRRWYEANLEQHHESAKRWQKEHPEYYRRKVKEWREANLDRAKEINRRSRLKNINRVLFSNRIRRARKFGAAGSHTFQEIQLVYQYQQGKCFHCGIEFNGKYTEDHVIPLVRGGTDYIENIVLMCRSCNSRKGTRLLHEWHPEKYLPGHQVREVIL